MSLLEDELGDVISKARRGLGLTPEQLARQAGLAPADIVAIESYRIKPESSTLDVIASVLGLDAAKLGVIAAESWSPRVTTPSTPVAVKRVSVPLGDYSANCYVAACVATGKAVVVDPGGVLVDVLAHLHNHDWQLLYILITHAHSDHIGGLNQILERYPSATVVSNDLERNAVMRGLAYKWEPAQNEVHIPLGNLRITPIFTPGHTLGSTSYRLANVCFTGDTLFAGSIGRPAGPLAYQTMLTAIRQGILLLPPHTILLPGHGPATTVAEEKLHNPFF